MPRVCSPTLRLLCTALLTAQGMNAAADAFRVPYQGAAAAGQAEAFAAQADDPSALFYNPAGMTQLRGVQFSAGTNLVGGGLTYHSPTGQRVEGDLGGSVAVPPPGNIYITANLKDLGFNAIGPISVGVGLASPYGLIMRYPKGGPFSNVVTSTRLPLLDIKPTVAYRINDMLSFGLGLDIYTFASFLGEGQYSLKRGVPGLGASELTTNGTGIGYNASLMFTPFRTEQGLPKLNVGFVYRSQTKLPMTGQLRVNDVPNHASVTPPLPQVITGAVAFWPIRDGSREWKVEYDMDFVGWDAFKSFDVTLPGGVVSRTPQNWKSIYTASLGTEYKWLDAAVWPDWEIALRGGYQRSNSPIPDATFSPTVPDADWNIVAIGVGLTCKRGGRFMALVGCGSSASGAADHRSIGVDLAFQAAFFDTRTIARETPANLNGTYRSTLYIGSLNIRMAF
jgi:long-chain fatty acid transport protein